MYRGSPNKGWPGFKRLVMHLKVSKLGLTVSEFDEFKPRLKSPKNRFQLSAGLNLEKFNTSLSETNHIWAAAQIV